MNISLMSLSHENEKLKKRVAELESQLALTRVLSSAVADATSAANARIAELEATIDRLIAENDLSWNMRNE